MNNKNTDNLIILEQLKNLIDLEIGEIGNLANACALLFQNLNKVNWVGIYYYQPNDILYLGPFQGLPACTKIPLNKGVCGYAASNLKSIYVENVHNFPGHIACDANSKSEIVIPIFKLGKLYGVLDIDSYVYNNFTQDDLLLLERYVHIIESELLNR